jgi:hypothetical protein
MDGVEEPFTMAGSQDAEDTQTDFNDRTATGPSSAALRTVGHVCPVPRACDLRLQPEKEFRASADSARKLEGLIRNLEVLGVPRIARPPD